MTSTLCFVHRSQLVCLPQVSADTTLLDLIREHLGLKGTKEGCGEGDCGACTVMTAELSGSSLRYRAINSCIRLAHSIHGMALFTCEDLAQGDTLHPVQQALVDHHASQCGFCTPGFVMSLSAHFAQRRQQPARSCLSGNLCRCTGYRPLLKAASALEQLPAEAWPALDQEALVAQLKNIPDPYQAGQRSGYWAPRDLDQLLQQRALVPEAQVLCGSTDVGLWLNKLHHHYPAVLDVSRCVDLQRCELDSSGALVIGAAVTVEQAFERLSQFVPEASSMDEFWQRFAGLPIRQSASIGGNVANGSPIGDSMPLLLALRAEVELCAWREGGISRRSLALEDFYLGYRRTALAADELVCSLKIPALPDRAQVAAYKVSKRFEDDISAVALAVMARLEQGRIAELSIGAGGVAATPIRLSSLEQRLLGMSAEEACRVGLLELTEAMSPLSDFRASARYRLAAMSGLWQRFWDQHSETLSAQQPLSLS